MSSTNPRRQTANSGGDRRTHAADPGRRIPESPDVEIDGARLRQLRKIRGDDLKSFAARAGITFQYVSQLELGVRRRVSPPTFVRICNALGITDPHEMMMPNQSVQRPDHKGRRAGVQLPSSGSGRQ